jgi:hypothetical protein
MWLKEHSRSEDKNYCKSLIFTKPEVTKIIKKKARGPSASWLESKEQNIEPGCRGLDA